MSGLHDTDIVAWADAQVAALRRRAANEIDWDNIADEIESVGNAQRHAVASLLINIIRHWLQIAVWPAAAGVPNWQRGIGAWQGQLECHLQRCPRLRLEIAGALPDLYRDAIRTMYREIDGIPLPPLSRECPFTLQALMTEMPEPP
jgi:hypothetical protein